MCPDVSNGNHAQTLIINLRCVCFFFFSLSIAYNFTCCRRINANVYTLLFNSLFGCRFLAGASQSLEKLLSGSERHRVDDDAF